jgi:hypothetical protein
VHEAHGLAHGVGDLDAAAGELVGDLQHLQPVQGVEGVLVGDDGLWAHEVRHDIARRQ